MPATEGLSSNKSKENLRQSYLLRFNSILSQMCKNGEIIGWRQLSQSYTSSSQAGVDFSVDTHNGTIPFAVSSTKTERRERLRNHPGVPCIHIRKRSHGKDLEAQRADNSLRKNILTEIQKYLDLE